MERKVTYQYSSAFKRKVVEEIEQGKYTTGEARKVYDIRSAATLYYWLRKLGRNHLIGKVVEVKMRNESDKIKELEKRNRHLEKLLADKDIEIFAWKTLLEVAEEHYGDDFKKNFSTKLSSEQKGLVEESLKEYVKSTATQGKAITNGQKS